MSHDAGKAPRGRRQRRFLLKARCGMEFSIEFEQEEDGRWIAEIPELPGVLVYGATKTQAGEKAKALALRVLAERMESESAMPVINHIVFTSHDAVALG
jgi:predicted RNase H-like HicB family nuclease